MSSRTRLSGGVVAAVVLPLCSMLAGAAPASAAAKEKPPTGRISVTTRTDEDKLRNRPVMISVLADGRVVQQEEVNLGHATSFSYLPVGTYDVRVEGDGCTTLVKRGIHVGPDGSTNMIGGPIEPGQGVKVVEYATAAMTREELADRLAKLEAMIARLEARLARGTAGDGRGGFVPANEADAKTAAAAAERGAAPKDAK